jgi:enamine deaminase RidA (YjgF/YER057c/UK114 family)
MNAEARIKELGLTLPAAPKPVANYVPAARAGSLLFLSGVLPSRDGKLLVEGKLGRDLTVEQGYEAARIAVLNALAIVRSQVGALSRVKQIVKLVGYVASAEGFVQQPAVINGASDLLVKLFGEAGRHARVAVGAAQLPLNAPVELEIILQVS